MSDKTESVTLLSLPSLGTTARASSVLQKNSKLYGPSNALDYDNGTTCWNSEGCPNGKQSSSYLVDFGRPVKPTELRIQFQAGFAAEEVTVSYLNGQKWEPLIELEVEDDHDMQRFDLLEDRSDEPTTTSLKFVFEECTDFYSRVTVYKLQVWGHEVAGTEKSDKE